MGRLGNCVCLTLGAMLAAVFLTACGGGGGSSSSATSSPASSKTSTESYATTTSKGDYSEWTLTGDALAATWNVVGTDGSIAYTYTFTATCGAADATYGTRSCSVTTQSCADGSATCPTSGTVPSPFTLMEAPGVALFVQTGSGATSQLHVGFTKDASACTEDVSGDYTMVHTGLGLTENFGIYRSDADFINIAHADFGFDSGSSTATPTVAYRSGSGADTLTDGGCSAGVRTRSVGGETLRAMITHSGLFVVDLPSGQGGLLSFKTSDAATLADFASKSFGGVSFPDDSAPLFLRGDTDAVSGDEVTLHAQQTDGSGGTTTGTLHLEALTAAAAATSPAYPDFTAVPSGYGASPLVGDYANPAAIPGLFKISDPVDNGRVIMAAMKFSGKVIVVGMVYNYRTTTETNPATGVAFPADGLYNTGNFILFEM